MKISKEDHVVSDAPKFAGSTVAKLCQRLDSRVWKGIQIDAFKCVSTVRSSVRGAKRLRSRHYAEPAERLPVVSVVWQALTSLTLQIEHCKLAVLHCHG